MYLFLGWRLMEDRIGSVSHVIEHCLWGDGRAAHTFLLASTDEYPLVIIEIDVGDREKGIRKSMTLHIAELDETPKTLVKCECLGNVKSPTVLSEVIQSACNYVEKHPDYHVFFNNCRTFVEYLIDQIPEFRDSIPRKNGSILEYYHHKEKHEHPGALVMGKRLLKTIRDLHHSNRKHKHTNQLLVQPRISQ